MASFDILGMAVHETCGQVLPGAQPSSWKVVRGFRVLSGVVGITAVSLEFAEWWAAQSAWKTVYTVETNRLEASVAEVPRRLLLDITFPHLECRDVTLEGNFSSSKWAAGILETSDVLKMAVLSTKSRSAGCRIKSTTLVSGEYGVLTYLPPTVNRSSPNLSHIINSASLTPIIGGPAKAVSLNIPNMGEKVELGAHQVTYDAHIIPTQVIQSDKLTLRHQNRVDTTIRPAGTILQNRRPGISLVIRTQKFGLRLSQDPPPSIMELVSRLIVCLGGILALFDFLCVLGRRYAKELQQARVIERLSSSIVKLSASEDMDLNPKLGFPKSMMSTTTAASSRSSSPTSVDLSNVDADIFADIF